MAYTDQHVRVYRNNNQKEFRQHANIDKHLRIARTTTGRESALHYDKAAKLHEKYHPVKI